MTESAIESTRRRKLSMHHMTGQTHLGHVPGMHAIRKAPTSTYQFDPFELGDFASSWVSGIVADQLVPYWVDKSKEWVPDANHPWLATKYGKTVRSRSVIFAANQVSDIVGQPIAWAVRKALHKSFPGIANDPGKALALQPANLIAASFVKTVSTGVAKTWLMSAWAPPAPAPTPTPTPTPPTPGPVPPPAPPTPPAPPAPPTPPAPGPGTPPKSPTPAPGPGTPPPSGAPKPPAAGVPQPGAGAQSASMPNAAIAGATKGPQFLGHDVKEISKETALFGVSLLISKVYDQTVGPLVQRVVNVGMGRSKEEIKKGKPINAGDLAQTLASAFISSFLLRPVSWSGKAGGLGPLLATSGINALVMGAFDSVWSRSVGPSISDAVNGVAGLPKVERQPETDVAERVVRTMVRSTASGAAYFAGDALTQGLFTTLGARIAGPFGIFVAMAGPAITGLVGASVVDGIIGAKLGSLGGTLYEWFTGKPKAEHRPPPAPKPAEATPGAGATTAAGAAATPAAGATAAPATATTAPAAGTAPAPGAAAPGTPAKKARKPRATQAQKLAAIAMAH